MNSPKEVVFKRRLSVEVIFGYDQEEFSLWVLEEGRQPREIDRSKWEASGRKQRISFSVEKPNFILAVKKYFYGPGRHKYGHFIYSITFNPS